MIKCFFAALTVCAMASAETELVFKELGHTPFSKASWPVYDSSKEQTRSIQSTTELDKFVGEFNSAKDGDKIANVISDAEKTYANSKDPSVRFLAQHVIFMKNLRGILWVMRPVVEKKRDQHRMLHSATVSFLKQHVSGQALYSPTNTSKALLNYYSAPYATNGILVGQMSSIEEVQNWLYSVIRPAMQTMVSKLEEIAKENPKVIWNMKVTSGPKSFPDGVGRDVTFGPEELQSLIATYELQIAQINFFSAYTQTKLFDLVKDSGKLYGFDGLLFADVDGVTSLEVKKMIDDKDYRGLWIRNDTNGFAVKAMSEAHDLLKSATDRLTETWTRIKARPGAQYSLPQVLVQMDIPRSDTFVDNMNRVLDGRPIRSSITGETANVNLKAFYLSPPKDLKSFYPTSREKEKELKAELTLTEGRKKVPYRNFLHGMPNEWSVSSYKPYMTVSSSEDVMRSLRVLQHTVGGFGFEIK